MEYVFSKRNMLGSNHLLQKTKQNKTERKKKDTLRKTHSIWSNKNIVSWKITWYFVCHVLLSLLPFATYYSHFFTICHISHITHVLIFFKYEIPYQYIMCTGWTVYADRSGGIPCAKFPCSWLEAKQSRTEALPPAARRPPPAGHHGRRAQHERPRRCRAASRRRRRPDQVEALAALLEAKLASIWGVGCRAGSPHRSTAVGAATPCRPPPAGSTPRWRSELGELLWRTRSMVGLGCVTPGAGLVSRMPANTVYRPGTSKRYVFKTLSLHLVVLCSHYMFLIASKCAQNLPSSFTWEGSR
jgi:hypothetical protein